MTMPESERIALIFRLAINSEKNYLGQDIQRVIESHHSPDYLETSLEKTRSVTNNYTPE